jgi:hypothetical protein
MAAKRIICEEARKAQTLQYRRNSAFVSESNAAGGESGLAEMKSCAWRSR